MNGYGKVYHLGSRDVKDILEEDVYVEEKIDGSQFSFGADKDGNLWCASRAKPVPLDTTDKLFKQAVATAIRVNKGFGILDGKTIRGEAVMGPRHNKLRYDRGPEGGFIVFDMEDEGGYFARESVEAYSDMFGLEVVALLGSGRMSASDVEDLVVGPSALGGCAREGVVVKTKRGGHGRMKAKIVGDAFKEKLGVKPKGAGRIGSVVGQYRTEARWDKAIQHVREAGELAGTPKDIPLVMREIVRDMVDECEEEIMEHLWPKVWKEVIRGVSKGAAEYYIRTLRTDGAP